MSDREATRYEVVIERRQPDGTWVESDIMRRHSIHSEAVHTLAGWCRSQPNDGFRGFVRDTWQPQRRA